MAKLSDLSKGTQGQSFTSPYINPPTKRETTSEGEFIVITGMVEGVVLTGFEMTDSQYGRSALFTFTNEEGQTTRKFVNEVDDPESEAGKGILNNVYNLHAYFFDDTDQKMVDEKGNEKEFNGVEDLCNILFADQELPSTKKGKLKMILKNKEGKYPTYTIPNYNWFGDDIYFSKKEQKDKLRFKRVEADESQATFSSGLDSSTGDNDLF